MNRLERKLCLFVYLRLTFVHENLWVFVLEVSILKGEIMSFFIQGIDQKSSQNLSKTFPISYQNRGLEAS